MRRFIKLTTLSIICASVVAASGGGAASPLKAAGPDPREDLVRAMRALSEARSFRATMVLSGPNGLRNVIRLEYVAPDRFHLNTEWNFPIGPRTIKQEIIAIGKDSYAKSVVNGQWLRAPAGVSREVSKLRDPIAAGYLEKIADVRLIGNDTHDGLPMRVYQFTHDDTSDTGFKSVVKTWVGVKDALPHRIEGAGEAPDQGEGSKMRTVYTYSDHNADIKIEPPM